MDIKALVHKLLSEAINLSDAQKAEFIHETILISLAVLYKSAGKSEADLILEDIKKKVLAKSSGP